MEISTAIRLFYPAVLSVLLLSCTARLLHLFRLRAKCNVKFVYYGNLRAQEELCRSGGGRPGLPVPNSPYGLCGRKATLNCSSSELRSCVKVEVAVQGSPSLIVLVVSVEVKRH